MDALDTVPMESQDLRESIAASSMHGQTFEIEESPQPFKNKDTKKMNIHKHT